MNLDIIVSLNYELYKEWFEKALDYVWKLPPELKRVSSPMKALEDSETISKKRAVKALTEGIRDTLSLTDRYSSKDIFDIDVLFSHDNLPLLSLLKNLFDKQTLSILKKNNIESEQEYYWLKSIESMDISPEVKEITSQIIEQYERKIR